MEEALIARLLGSSAVIALVGNRIFPGAVPQGAQMPGIVINVLTGAPLYADDGECGLAENRVQIDCWADSYAAAKKLGRAVHQTLSAFDGTVNGVEFQFITLEDERDLRESGTNAAEYRYRNSRDFIVWHRPPV